MMMMNKTDINFRPTGDPSLLPKWSKEGMFVILHKVDFLCIEHYFKYIAENLSNTCEDFPGGMADKVKVTALAH